MRSKQTVCLAFIAIMFSGVHGLRGLHTKEASRVPDMTVQLEAGEQTDQGLPNVFGGDVAKVPKIVWLLWFDGWDNAPYVPKMVEKSWKRHNPTWDIRLLTNENLPKYIDMDLVKGQMAPQAASDMIRISLLAKHGGVWADSGMLCMHSLDSWVPETVEKKGNGIWMYRGRGSAFLEAPGGGPGGPASWFIVASPGNYVMKAWQKRAQEFWEVTGGDYDYFWLDNLFEDLLGSDKKFRKVWANEEHIIQCNDDCQAHMLHTNPDNEVARGLTGYVRDCLDNRPPHAMKLNREIDGDWGPEATNGHYAIFTAVGGTSTEHEMLPPILWEPPKEEAFAKTQVHHTPLVTPKRTVHVNPEHDGYLAIRHRHEQGK